MYTVTDITTHIGWLWFIVCMFRLQWKCMGGGGGGDMNCNTCTHSVSECYCALKFTQYPHSFRTHAYIAIQTHDIHTWPLIIRRNQCKNFTLLWILSLKCLFRSDYLTNLKCHVTLIVFIHRYYFKFRSVVVLSPGTLTSWKAMLLSLCSAVRRHWTRALQSIRITWVAKSSVLSLSTRRWK